jgi:hypothetical protein
MDKHNLDKIDDGTTEKRGLNRQQIIKIIAISFIGGAITQGPSKFFIGLGVAPIDTLASVLGVALVPLVISYLAALLIAKLSSVSMYKVWIGCLVAIMIVMFVGSTRGAP